MSEPYDEKLYCCDRCAEFFTKEDMIEDRGEVYCKGCYEKLLERGE